MSDPISRLNAFIQDEREAYSEGMEYARETAIDRAIDGIPEYSHDKDGNVLLDPTLCRCGHDDDDHHLTLEEGGVRIAQSCVCTVGGCDCERFLAAPYVKRVYSDKLLDRILTHGLPKEVGPQAKDELVSALERLDVSRLPHDIINDIANKVPLGRGLDGGW